MTGGSCPRAAAARRFFGVAQVVDALKGSIRPNIMQDVILLRRPDPGKLCPVKLGFRATDKLVEIKCRIKSAERQTVGFGYSINVIRGYGSTCPRHVLRHHLGVPRN